MSRVGFIAIILAFIFISSFGQKGFLRGRIIDESTGEALTGVTVVAPTINAGTITDFDGNYSLSLPQGAYDIMISYISYTTQNQSNIEITAGKVTILNANLSQTSLGIEEVVVTAKLRQRTEAAIQVQQRRAPVVLDGISADQISRLGDSDAASALKRVTGVSVTDGKYVYVRGLSDRYMKVTLNGAEVPGLDPNFNTVQMDLFPSNIVENILVLKTYSPDQPSFTGGLVDISTRTFPEKFSLQMSASTGFNTNTHFNNKFLTYQGSNTDWLGYDNNFRVVPKNVKGIDLPSGTSSTAVEHYGYASSFNKIWDLQRTQAKLNKNYSLSMGGQTQFLGKSLGLIGALSYQSESEFYENGRLDEYDAMDESTVAGHNLLAEDKGSENIIWSALASANLKLNPMNKISLNYLRNQNGEQIGRFMDGFTVRSDNYALESVSLEYLERSLSAWQLIGKHVFPSLNGTSIEWISSYTHSKQDEPDIRFFIMEVDSINGEKVYSTRSNRKPERRYREMWEYNWNSKIDLTIPFKVAESEIKIKTGAAYLEKFRNSDENRYTVNRRGSVDFNGTPSDYVRDTILLGYEGSTRGVFYDNDFPTNRYYSFQGKDIIYSAYLMADIQFSKKLRMVTGVRAEKSSMYIANKVDTTIGDKESLLGMGESDDLDFLPSLNISYEVIDKMNIRLGYSRSLGRPSFRERAPYEFYEYTEGISILGNPELKRVLADNLDFRWEYFFKPGEMVSASLFYKKLYKPIERYQAQTVSNISTYRNGYDADLYGLELELRKKFDFISALKDFAFGLNLTLVKSTTPVDSVRLELAREIIADFPDTRPLFSQAPYIINSFLSYNNSKLGLESNIAFNIEGPKIVIISKFQTPDVYQRPMPLINYNVSKKIFKDFELSFSVKNILDSEFKQTIILENGDEYPFRMNKSGRTFSFGISYKI
jgi:outer membrane receptor protein involved in Fe transport